jgi:hypothetical protein
MRRRPTCAARPTCRRKNASRPSASRATCWGASRRWSSSGWATCRWSAATPTLSPGELQRLRLATQLGSHLFGVVYVLDEPSAGLHPADGEALLDALQRLKAAGNTLFVVEHDVATMRRADWLVDVGPDAGERGGSVLYSGPPAGLAQVQARARAPTCSARCARPCARRARGRVAGCGWKACTATTWRAGRRVPPRLPHRGDRRVGLGQVEPGDAGAAANWWRAPGRATTADSEEEAEDPLTERARHLVAAASPG